MNVEQGILKQEVLEDCRFVLACVSNCSRRNLFAFNIRYSFLFISLVALACCNSAAAQVVPAEQKHLSLDTSSTSLASTFARLIENSIPREYEKRKDWGKTKVMTVGVRNEGFKLHRRQKPVKHGVWKHYKIRLIEPEKNLVVRIENLRPVEGGRIGFTLVLQAKFDLWARAKVYQYGVHLIALETLGDAAIDLAIDCEIGVRLQTQAGHAGVGLDPQVIDARLDIVDFHLRRVSNAKGPIIRELGEELPRVIERELQGPKLVAKLNRAVDKKRDRLELSFAMMNSK